MILRALYDLAKREELVSDPDFPLAPVTWLVTVTGDGRIAGVSDTRVEVASRNWKPKMVPTTYPVPYQQGRSGTKAPAAFLVDNAKYVFGLSTPDKPFSEAEGAEKSGWFRQLVRDCVEATGDAGVRAVLAALESTANGSQSVTLPDDCRSNDLFAFIYEPDVDLLVHLRPAVQAYWRELRRSQIALPHGTSGEAFECIVTGVPVAAPALFPKAKYVPGGLSSGSSLVSFNAAAFSSFGLEANENAPISRGAAEACATALNRLLHPAFPDPRPAHRKELMPLRNYRLSEDTVACYWSDTSAADPLLNALSDVFAPDPAKVRDVYESVWRGNDASIGRPGNFYALVLSGAQGRVTVRDWFTSSVAVTSANVARHFDDLEIVRNTPVPKGGQLSEVLPLRILLESLAPFGRRDAIPPVLAANIFTAALKGTPYPISILQRALERARAEIGKSEWPDLERRDARAALIKAVLVRRRRQRSSLAYPEITVSLDLDNTSPGYLCGRLMAIIERLQQAALGDINASVVDRFFGAASATPRTVFTRLLRNARYHARKAKDEASTAGLAYRLESQLDSITSHFDVRSNGFPAFLDLEQQGLFMLGYHQQRHEIWKKRKVATETPVA